MNNFKSLFVLPNWLEIPNASRTWRCIKLLNSVSLYILELLGLHYIRRTIGLLLLVKSVNYVAHLNSSFPSCKKYFMVWKQDFCQTSSWYPRGRFTLNSYHIAKSLRPSLTIGRYLRKPIKGPDSLILRILTNVDADLRCSFISLKYESPFFNKYPSDLPYIDTLH